MASGPPLLHGAQALARSGGDLARDDLGMAAVSLAVAGWIVFLLARQRWGRDPSARPSEVDGGAPSLPEDSVVIAHALHHGGVPEADVLGAVLLDLGRRGYLEIAEEARGPLDSGRPAGWRFRRREPPQGELAPYENALYTRLFATSSETNLAAVTAWVQANRQQAKMFVERVRRYIAGELRAKGYVERPQRLPVVLNLGSAGLVVVVSLAALLSGAWVALLAGASGVLQASRNRVLRRRTAAGSTRALAWSVVATALRSGPPGVPGDEGGDAGAGSGVPDPAAGLPDDEAEAERLLVYAAALGVARGLASRLEEHRPRLVGSRTFLAWYERPDVGHPHLGGIGDLAEAVGSAFDAGAEAPTWQAVKAARLGPRASSGDPARR